MLQRAPREAEVLVRWWGDVRNENDNYCSSYRHNVHDVGGADVPGSQYQRKNGRSCRQRRRNRKHQKVRHE